MDGGEPQKGAVGILLDIHETLSELSALFGNSNNLPGEVSMVIDYDR